MKTLPNIILMTLKDGGLLNLMYVYLGLIEKFIKLL